MNSITYGVGRVGWFILTVPMIHVSGTDYQFLSEAIPVDKTPFNFIYNANNYLLMEITIMNIPSTVTEVYIKHKIGANGNFSVKAVNIEKNTGKYVILGRLIFSHILVEVELRTKTGACAKQTVADGRNWESWRFSYSNIHSKYMLLIDKTRRYYEYAPTCLAPNICNIIMDMKNKCQEGFMCYIDAPQYICTMQNATVPYKLYQTYGDSIIGQTLNIKSPNLILTITLELFDVNTSVNIVWERNIIGSEKVPLMAANAIKDYNVITLKYSDTKEVQFGCQKLNHRNYIYVNLGIINTTDNKIKTINTSLIKKKFELEDNGTILCCLYYLQNTESIATFPNKVSTITRLVENKTMLIYQGNESIENYDSDQAISSTEHTDYSWLLYVFVTLIAVSALVLVFCMIYKQYWFTNVQPIEETMESENQPHPNQVLYANLNFVNNASQPRDPTEESHYANIIGELHPL